jgi:hypothetical protein
VPNVTFTIGSPKLPLQNCALENPGIHKIKKLINFEIFIMAKIFESFSSTYSGKNKFKHLNLSLSQIAVNQIFYANN